MVAPTKLAHVHEHMLGRAVQQSGPVNVPHVLAIGRRLGNCGLEHAHVRKFRQPLPASTIARHVQSNVPSSEDGPGSWLIPH